MDFLVSAQSDVGIVKVTNQDSLSVKTASTPMGKIAFAVLCDGMGGLQKGEVASATLVKAFSDWFNCDLKNLIASGFNPMRLQQAWNEIVTFNNQKIMNYGNNNCIRLGTTITAMLIIEGKYYILNIGDTRAYKIDDKIDKITQDQTVIAREILKGSISEVAAKQDPRRGILLQCVGASNVIAPDFFSGDVKPNEVYMLCSDGFRHEITEDEMFSNLNPNIVENTYIMDERMKYLIELNKQRQERDNISVVLIKTI